MNRRLRPNERLPGFVLEKLISQGGMAQLWLAHRVNQPVKKVALKIQLSNEKSYSFQDLIRKEADILSQLRHPNIVHIFPIPLSEKKTYFSSKSVVHNDAWFFAMELIKGESLDKYLNLISNRKRIGKHKNGQFSVDWCVELFYRILITVKYVHDMGYAHLDLKLENILLRYPPDPLLPPFPVLIDFGTATRFKDEIDYLAGSAGYTASEIINAMRNEHYDRNISTINIDLAKSDVFSLGVIFFEILTGRYLFEKKEKKTIGATFMNADRKAVSQAQSVMQSGVHHNLARFSEFRSDADPSLATVLENMLTLDPSKRASIAEVLAAIEEYIASIRPPRI